MTHIVIPVADEPKNHSLRYALATIRLHTDLTPVTIGKDYGHCDHIPTMQGRDKFANTTHALHIACTTDWISDPFIWSADDIYWLHPANPIRWALGNLRDTPPSTVYGKRKHQTAHILDALGLPTLDYESHTPLPVHKTPMLEALTHGGSPRSMYGNLTGQPDLIAPDVKLRTHTTPLNPAPWASTEGNPTRYETLTAHVPGLSA